jgi:hypothetical protein
VESADFERLRQKFEAEVRMRLDGAMIDKVELLQYGDIPEIEPGEVLGKIFLALPEGADAADMAARREAFSAFNRAHREALTGLRKALGATAFGGGLSDVNFPNTAVASERGPVVNMKMKLSRVQALGPELGPSGDETVTAVMARLGGADLETLDTLIAAGIASSRAEAVRWALARIRERPAYEQLRARVREIENLKSQF